MRTPIVSGPWCCGMRWRCRVSECGWTRVGSKPSSQISRAIVCGLARSRALLAFYSAEYPARRACQWELTAAFLAAQQAKVDPRQRVLVVNPEPGVDHVQPVELRDALYAHAASLEDTASHRTLAEKVTKHVHGLKGLLGDFGVPADPLWCGRERVGAARFVGRVRDMWAVHSALAAGKIGLITGARGDPALQVMGMGGIGKSLLAHKYALRFGGAYPGGVFWLRAHGHDDTSETFTAEEENTQREDDRDAHRPTSSECLNGDRQRGRVREQAVLSQRSPNQTAND
jgi:hypothetical protein